MFFPPFLTVGDAVRVLAPSGVINSSLIRKNCELLTEWGLQVDVSQFPEKPWGSLAEEDALRWKKLQTAIDDPAVKAIFCARGGYGITRILDRLDISPLLQFPKWIIGFSDITALHLKLQKAGMVSVHGPMPVLMNGKTDPESLSYLKDSLFGNTVIHYSFQSSNDLNRTGQAQGQLVGGNLSLLVNQLGTDTALNTAGKILFLEEVGEYRYQLDRMLVQLQRAGLFANLAGLLVGQFSDTLPNPTDEFPLSVEALVAEKVRAYDFPVAFNFPAGHTFVNHPLVLGAEAELEVEKNLGSLRYSDKNLLS